MVLSLFAYQLWEGYRATIEAEERNSRNLVRSLESHIERLLREKEQLLVGVGDLYLRLSSGGFFDEEQFHTYLDSSAARLPQVRTLFLLDAQAHVLATAHVYPLPEALRDKKAGFFPEAPPSDRSFFLGRLRDSPAFAQKGDQWSFPVFHRIQDSKGQTRGYVVGIIDPAILNNFLSTLEVGAYGDALIWDQSGRLIAAHPNSRLDVGSYSDYAVTAMTTFDLEVRSPDIDTLLGDLEGSEIILSNKGIEGGEIGLVAFLNSRDYLTSWRKSVLTAGLTSVFVLTLLTGLTVLLGRELKQKAQDEAALETAKLDAEQANLAKTHFLAQVSHEFRTPLNAIIGFSGMMKVGISGGQPKEKYLEYADDILTSGNHLLSVVNDVIDLSRIEAGELLQNSEKLNVGLCIAAVLRLLAKDIADRKVTVTTTTSNAECQLTVDKRLIEQVLINLITNAVKFSSVGGDINIDVADDSEEFVEICISDQGGGIDPKIFDRIGEPFLVGSAQISAEGQGAGLGLSISKKIMEAIGGQLIIESRLNQGTDARMRFPKAMSL